MKFHHNYISVLYRNSIFESENHQKWYNGKITINNDLIIVDDEC